MLFVRRLRILEHFLCVEGRKPWSEGLSENVLTRKPGHKESFVVHGPAPLSPLPPQLPPHTHILMPSPMSVAKTLPTQWGAQRGFKALLRVLVQILTLRNMPSTALPRLCSQSAALEKQFLPWWSSPPHRSAVSNNTASMFHCMQKPLPAPSPVYNIQAGHPVLMCSSHEFRPSAIAPWAQK